jgi:rhamnosyltransferase
VVVVNSSSGDGTVEEAERLGAETLVIPRREFNHGATRERARHHLGTDIVVMVTPDAYARDAQTLGRLVRPLLEGRVSVAYARQVPRAGAGILESAPRAFNFPTASHERGIEDLPRFGSYVYYCSNACAAYRNDALDEVGGFPPVLTNEDAVTVARLVRLGHRVAYVAEAEFVHSHAYGLASEFRRHWDTGYARRQHADALSFAGGDGAHGRRYARWLIRRLVRDEPPALPYGIVQLGVKWLGYRAGWRSHGLPLSVRRALSGQDYYWVSAEFLSGRSEPTLPAER